MTVAILIESVFKIEWTKIYTKIHVIYMNFTMNFKYKSLKQIKSKKIATLTVNSNTT